MIPIGQWLLVDEIPREDQRTSLWKVFSKSHGRLGSVHWDGSRHRYVFTSLTQITLHAEALAELSNFLTDAMTKRVAAPYEAMNAGRSQGDF